MGLVATILDSGYLTIFSSLQKVPISEIAPVGELIYPRFYD